MDCGELFWVGQGEGRLFQNGNHAAKLESSGLTGSKAPYKVQGNPVHPSFCPALFCIPLIAGGIAS
jgi:hypothetical protein